MAWYDEAVFYHIYPLGLAGAPKENPYGGEEHRLKELTPWIAHMKEIGCTALYIGPLFESVGHGYETTDYKKLDSRLGNNQDLTDFVAACHAEGIRVIFDGVFNHTGRDFFAFQDIKKNRENSAYRDWYCNVNFYGNNEYNDGFSYDNWGGYNLLVKLNQRNPAVRDYICDVIRFWVKEFDIDGIRLDAADVLDFDYMKALRGVANEVKPDFWLMGEVIHGDYSRWVNEGTLHSVTNYHLHKALYSGHNDHNYFEIAHTVKRLNDLGGNRSGGLKLYNFVDNHDVERIYTKLNNKAHFAPAHVLLYTLPGVPSVYYGSEFGIEGKKEKWSDDSLRPALKLSDFAGAVEKNPCTKLIAKLGRIRQQTKALSYGDYRELLLTNRQYAFSRTCGEDTAVVTVNNDESDFVMTLACGRDGAFYGALSGELVTASGGRLCVNVKANSGEIWLPVRDSMELDAVLDGEVMSTGKTQAGVMSTNAEAQGSEVMSTENTPLADGAEVADTNVMSTNAGAQGSEGLQEEVQESGVMLTEETVSAEASKCGKDIAANSEVSVQIEVMSTKDKSPKTNPAYDEAFEKGKIAGLQEAILAIMERNGCVTEQMRHDVYQNTHHDSLINWVKSFR